MSNSLPRVGVDLVALGAADYLQALKEANQRMLESQDVVKKLVAQLSLLPPTNEKAQQSISILTNQLAEQQAALAKMAVANVQGSKQQEEATVAYNESTVALNKTIAALRELTGVGPKAQETVGQNTREARGFRDALFGAGLGISLLDSALGSQLPASAKQASNSLRLTADTMLAFAFLAPESGPVGLAIGALIGLFTSLGISAITIDPQIKALNDSLDKLGKKDDAAQGLAKLANVNDTNAKAALAYLDANKQLADSFQAQVQAAEPATPVLQGLGDALRAVQDAVGKVNEEYLALNPVARNAKAAVGELGKEIQGGVTGITTLVEALAQGSNALDAIRIASIAARAAHDGNAAATANLTKRTLELAAAQNYLAGAQARTAVDTAQQNIDKLKLEGGSVDELRKAYYDLLKAKQDAANFAGVGAGKVGTNPVISPNQVEGAIAGGASDLSFLNNTATKLAKDLLSIQKQYNDDSANLAEDHARRLDEIGSNAYEQQVRMERDLVRRLKEIRDQYNQDVTDAGADYAQRVADAEANAQEQRDKIVQDYADRRAQIEKDYQDKVQQIQADYALSLIDIDARRDGLALLRARASRDKQLADAAKQRDKDNEAAQKARDKQQKDLEDSLAKQKKTLQDEFDRRMRDLKQSYDKQNAANQQNYQDQITDLNTATANQRNAEDAAYKKSKRQLDDQLKERRQSILDNLDDTLSKTKDKEVEYARAVLEALKSVLDPTIIADLLQQWQQTLQARIDIKVTPFDANLNAPQQPPGPPQPFAEGGYISRTQRALVHAGETVLPAQDAQRAYNLASQHLSRVSMPLSGRYMQSNSTSGSIKLYIDNSINSALLSSQIRAESTGVVVDIVKRARS